MNPFLQMLMSGQMPQTGIPQMPQPQQGQMPFAQAMFGQTPFLQMPQMQQGAGMGPGPMPMGRQNLPVGFAERRGMGARPPVPQMMNSDPNRGKGWDK